MEKCRCKVCGYVYEGEMPNVGTKTESNMLADFSGESQARNQYTYFASVVQKRDTNKLLNCFCVPPENEKEKNYENNYYQYSCFLACYFPKLSVFANTV